MLPERTERMDILVKGVLSMLWVRRCILIPNLTPEHCCIGVCMKYIHILTRSFVVVNGDRPPSFLSASVSAIVTIHVQLVQFNMD